MAAVFSPRADTLFRIALVVAVCLPAGAIAGLMLLARSPLGTGQYDMLSQPVPFDHRHHARDEGIDCRYCHDLVERSPYAGIPPTSKCMNCHAQIWNQAALLDPVRASVFDDVPIRWNKVHRLPDHVYFNHAIHVSKGVGCVTCHGRVDQMPLVRQARELTMGWCLDCHRRPEGHLRPRAEVTNMDWKPNVDPVQLGRELARRYDVRPRTNCTTCHR
ncbi:MAG: cytochrome c3 family protein [Myxococcaceae bacterium]